MSEKSITKEELSKVKYGQLLEKFTELGVPEVWKPGSKKMVMIEKAVEQIKLKASLESQGLDEKEVAEKIVEIKEAKVVAQQQEELQEAIAAEEAQKKDEKKTKELKMTKEQIEWNLKMIEQNMKFGVAAQRVALMQKRDFLQDLLKNM